ncbi:hypothetical protein PHYBOEH_008929 [Phytophthora boehmeriae]|uniref:Uncharacterized protein n=1 Tax=Phytophthora boehmeriae TaxID=109152 RepID=A0A8T1X0P6_9STRA|nr:hypothetical protein PHYBOEH_008929 [Phytophthora boehmeriae]
MTHFLATAALSAALVASKATADNYFIAAEAPDYNNNAVGKLLENVDSLRAPGQAYAVFDWSSTSMFGDLSYTTAYYQVDSLSIRFAPEDFATIFSLGYNSSSGDACFINGTNSVIGQDLNGTDVTLAAALNSTAADYKVLYDAYIAPTFNLTNGSSASVSLEETKETAEFANFRAKLGFLLNSIEVQDGGDWYSDCAMTIAMSILPRLFVGMTEDEMISVVRSSLRWNMAEGLEDLTFNSTGDLTVQGWYTKGMRLFNGQETTMRALRATGVEVYIISASPQIVVEEAANIFGLGNMVPGDHVYGVRFKNDDAGLFTAELQDDYPITWGPGKETIVTTLLKPKYNGSAPIFGSGDSDGDCEMLSTVRDGVVDTINRLQSNATCINSYYQKACGFFNTTDPSTNNTYLLQGQDEVIGTWITSGFTTKDGVTYKSGVTDFDGCKAYQFLDSI